MVEGDSGSRPAHDDELRLAGLAVSRGIGEGPVEFISRSGTKIPRTHLDPALIDEEVDRLRAGSVVAIRHLDDLIEARSTPETAAEILQTHELILESITERAAKLIREERINAEWAVLEIAGSDNANPSVGDKHIDIEDAAERLVNELIDEHVEENIAAGTVIVARELRPSKVLELAQHDPAALVTEHGGWTSHSSIMAREMRIPMVTGVKLSGTDIARGTRVVVDGEKGEVIIGPTAAEPKISHQQSLADVEKTRANVGTFITADGVSVNVFVNADSPEAFARALELGTHGVGLYRSDILISSSGEIPDEEVQLAAYSAIAEAAQGMPVYIRTFDDIHVVKLSSRQRNPALGLRSIRLCLSEERVFRTQVRALLRANVNGNIHIILPFISGIEELRRARDILHQEFRAVGENPQPPPLGVMVEVPSAVLAIHDIAREADVLCLGTNDLVQYLLAVDRDNDLVAAWYQTIHPSVLRAIGMVVDAAAIESTPLTVCGEMAGSPFYVPLLIGFGVRNLSMSGNSIPGVAKLISGLDIDRTGTLASLARRCSTAAEVESLMISTYKREWPSLIEPSLLEPRIKN